MKFNNKISLLFVVVCCSAFTFVGCNEEAIDTTKEVLFENQTSIKVINYGRSTAAKNSTNKNGFTGTSIAIFNDEISYKNYVEDLEEQVENWDNQFLEQWGHLSEEELNAKEEEIHFDSEKPLTDFENQIGLPSLRQQYNLEEEMWLNNDVLVEETDPDAKAIYDFDSEELAVMNTLAEVQIGTTIIKKLTDDEIELLHEEFSANKSANGKNDPQLPTDVNYIIIENSDYDALIDFNNGDTSVVNNNPNVSTTNSSSATSCKYGKSKRKYIDTAPGRRIKALIKVPQPRWGANGKVKAKVKSYKKKGSKWKKRRTKIDVGLKGIVYNSNCSNTPVNLDYWKGEKRKKKRKIVFDDPTWGSHIVKNGEMKGQYKQNGVIKELTLTW